MQDESQCIRSLIDLPVHLTTEHVIGFLYVIGLIHLSATCRTWYAVRRSVLQTTLSAVIVLGGFIYAFGGCDGTLSSAERYDPSTNVWSAIGSLTTARFCHGVSVLGGFVYAVGGLNPHRLRPIYQRVDGRRVDGNGTFSFWRGYVLANNLFFPQAGGD